MALFLVQHGKSLPKEIDPEQSLSEEGRSEVEYISGLAKDHKVRVARIGHSGKTRARQTAEIFASALMPEKGVTETPGLNPLDDVAISAKGIDSREDMMLVGHLPFMERLTSYLITGSPDRPVFKFQNGGVVCLDRDSNTGFWVIKWALTPRIG